MPLAASARHYDRNGWFEIKNQPLSRAGVFQYLGKNIPGAPDPNKMYNVLRSPDALANQEFLDSLKLTPWIDVHEMLGSGELGRTPAEQKGVGGVIGEQIYFDADSATLYGNVKMFSEAHKNVIDAVGRRELSLGYYSQYRWESGVYEGQPYEVVQIPRYGNHLASVDDGRMGEEFAVLDHLVFTVDSMEFEKMATKTVRKIGITVPAKLKDGATLREVLVTVPTLDAKDKPKVIKLSVPTFDADEASAENEKEEGSTEASGEMTLDDALAALGALMPILEKFGVVVAPQPAPTKGEGADPVIPVVDADNDDDKKNTVAATVDAADIARKVRAEIVAANKLGDELSHVVGTFDYSAKTEQEIAEYGIEKLKLTCTKGAELPTLRGYLAAAKSKPAVVATTDAKDGSNATPFFQEQLDSRVK